MIVFYQKRHHAFSYMIPFIFPTALQYYTILCSASSPKPQFLFYSFRLSASYPASVSDSPCVSGYRKLSPSGKCSCSAYPYYLELIRYIPFRPAVSAGRISEIQSFFNVPLCHFFFLTVEQIIQYCTL